MVIKCEKCGRPLGAELIYCSHRLRGECPYRLTQKDSMFGQKKSRFGGLFLLIGLAAVVGGLFFKGAGVFFIIIGLIFAVIGAFMTYGTEDTLYNKTTGQMWQRRSLKGFTLSEVKSSALKPVRFDAELIAPMDFPASIAALHQHLDNKRPVKEWADYAADVFYMALLSLLGQEIIEIKYATVVRSYLGRSPKISPIFALSLTDTESFQHKINGELEKQIVRYIKDWQYQTNIFIKAGTVNRLRDITHCFLVHDLVFLVMGGDHVNPGEWLITNVVGEEAVQRGLGTMKGRLIKSFELHSAARRKLKEDYNIIHTVAEEFRIAHRAPATQLRENLVKAIEACIDTD